MDIEPDIVLISARISWLTKEHIPCLVYLARHGAVIWWMGRINYTTTQNTHNNPRPPSAWFINC